MTIGKFLFGSTVRLVTPLDQPACVARLKEISREPSLKASVEEREFYWQKDNGNMFRTRLAAVLVAEPTGTRIVCRFGLGLASFFFSAIFMIFAFGAPLVELFTDDFIKITVNDAPVTDQTHRLLMTLTFLPVGLLAGGFSRWLARNEQDFMLGLLKDGLDAREIGGVLPAALHGTRGAPAARSPMVER